MKLIDSIIGQPKTFNESREEIQKPCLADLHEILLKDPIVKHIYYCGLKYRLSYDEILILIIQGLVKINDSRIERDFQELVNQKPKDIILDDEDESWKKKQT
jgi:hypothetical protein